MRPFPVRPSLRMRHHNLRSDNLAFVPASMLPFKEDWQRLANGLPHGNALFVVPDGESPIRNSMRSVAVQLLKHGLRVSAVASADLLRSNERP